jgi:hypothetical protein
MPTRSEFSVHRLNDEGLAKADTIAAGYSAFLDLLEQTVGPTVTSEAGRCMAIVRTKLQEANFFTKRAVAVDRKYQVIDELAEATEAPPKAG